MRPLVLNRLAVALSILLPGGSALGQDALPARQVPTLSREFKLTTVPLGYVETVGEGDTHLILIPEAGLNWMAWEPIMERLKGRYVCHAVTLPGIGATEAPELLTPTYETTWWLDNAERALAEYITENGLERVVIVGHGKGGGQLAWRVALDGPPAVVGAVAIASVPSPRMTGPVESISREERIRMVHERLVPRWAGEREEDFKRNERAQFSTVFSSPQRGEDIADILAMSTQQNIVRYRLEHYASDLEPRLPELDRPVLAIVPTYNQDPSDPESGYRQTWDEVSDLSPYVDVRYLKGARHFVQDDVPIKFDAILDGFVAGIPSEVGDAEGEE